MDLAKRIKEAYEGIKADVDLPDDWSPQDWIAAILVQLGRAAASAGYGDVEVFEQNIGAVAAIANHCLIQAEAGKLKIEPLT